MGIYSGMLNFFLLVVVVHVANNLPFVLLLRLENRYFLEHRRSNAEALDLQCSENFELAVVGTLHGRWYEYMQRKEATKRPPHPTGLLAQTIAAPQPSKG